MILSDILLREIAQGKMSNGVAKRQIVQLNKKPLSIASNDSGVQQMV